MKNRITNFVTLALVTLVIAAATTVAQAQIYTDLHDFNCTTEGCSPQNPAILAQGTDGNIYGTMYLGGTYNYGTVFQATPGGSVTILYTFDGNLGNGVNSRSGLTLGTDEYFYGTTVNGGLGHGTIFKITSVGQIRTLYSFTGFRDTFPYDGGTPFAPPIQGTSGDHYGVTMDGTAYRITAAGKFTSLSHVIPTDSPVPVLQATNSRFYGVNFQSTGTVFDFVNSTTIAPTIVHTFASVEGIDPNGPLVQSTDGNFYGTTTTLGPLGSASGTAFKMTTKGALTPLHAFDRNKKLNEGYSPMAGLVRATDGNFYGSTQSGGGSCDCGVLFELMSTGTYNVLHVFDGKHGAYPQSTLLQHTNGKMYGLAGGSDYLTSGVLYSLDVGLAPFAKLMTTQGKAGQVVEILGQKFTGTSSVMFGRGSASFNIVSDNYITATVPTAGTTGYVNMTTPSGTLTSSQTFKVLPSIITFSPTSGPVDTQVTIKGSGFIGATKVTFGGVKAVSYTVDSGTQITATVPTGAITGKIGVTTPGGSASRGPFTVI
jgi:uncharacterized repeat protein (TIGR03803 family)